jgi:serine/threonine protein kinase
MVVDQGLVKILDFGLAVAADRTRITATNTVLGTPSYMSPEQVRGEVVDHRSDLWSVGVVLHEMVTGTLPFRGENAHSVLNSILTQEPEPLTGLRTGVPIELDRIARKALAKDPDERYQHADDFSADLRLLQKQVSRTAETITTGRLSRPTGIQPRWFGWIPWGVAAIATLALIIVTTTNRVELQPPDCPAIRLSINLPEEAPLNIGMVDNGSIVISPNGMELVYVGKNEEVTRLFRRSLDGRDVTAIPETLEARTPFFSPDSQWLGFLADNEVVKSNLVAPGLRVAPVFGRRFGACWAKDGTIYPGSTNRTSVRSPSNNRVPLLSADAAQ